MMESLQEKRYYTGEQVSKDCRTPVSVRYASRYSLWIVFHQDFRFEGEMEVQELTISIDGRTVTLGPCRIIRDVDGEPNEYRAVPLQGIHDFEKLFFKNQVDTLESAAANISLILGYKDQIKPAFARFVSDLCYDLNSYRILFDEIDEKIMSESEGIRTSLQQGIIDSLGRKFLDGLEVRHSQLKEITRDYSQGEHEKHGYYFRKQLWNTILTAPLMTRTNTKPRGYIGDSVMMQMLYANTYEGDSTFGKLMHRHAVIQHAADAVRNRRYDMAQIVRDSAAEYGTPGEQYTILSIACGPAMELLEVYRESADADRYHFLLLDQDRHALLEASETVRRIEAELEIEVSADYVNESVRTMLSSKELREHWGRFNFIYSMGLFDYLTIPVAVALLRRLSNLLLPGGRMVIGNFARDNPSKTFMEYWMDWPLIYRDEEEMLHLASKLDGFRASVDRDESGIQMYLHLQKGNQD